MDCGPSSFFDCEVPSSSSNLMFRNDNRLVLYRPVFFALTLADQEEGEHEYRHIG